MKIVLSNWKIKRKNKSDQNNLKLQLEVAEENYLETVNLGIEKEARKVIAEIHHLNQKLCQNNKTN